jgi:hypothetical protein
VERHFRILDVDVTVDGPAEHVEPIAFAYRRFASDAAAKGATLVALADEAVSVDGRATPLIPGFDRTIQLYQRFVSTLMGHIASHAVLHAAAVVERSGGGALLLAAPSGHGKSSMTLELTRRGFGFLGDDYAPLDTGRRTIAPYPRAVGVVPARSAPIPEPWLARASDPETIRLGGKCLLDVGDVLGEENLAAESPLRHVVLLSAPDGERTQWPNATLVDVVSRTDDAEAYDALFRATDGVEIVRRVEEPHVRAWRLKLDPHRRPTAALDEALSSERLIHVDKRWDLRPSFTAKPQATKIRRREAAEFLGRELLNRRVGGRLLERYSGRVPELFMDVAGSLRDAACWRVTVGNATRTADLIESLVTS